jgi:folylpolyglutamate synthase/dihydropteroate synthase
LIGDRQATLIFAALADKDHNAMLAILRPLAKEIWLSEVPGQIRAIPSRELRGDPALGGSNLELVPPQEIVPRIRSAPRNEVFLITGSLMFAGWFLGEFQGRPASKP